MSHARTVLPLVLFPLFATCASTDDMRAAWSSVDALAPRPLVAWAGGDSESATPVFESFVGADRFEYMWMEVVVAPGSARFPSTTLRPTIDFEHCVGFALTGGTTWNSRGYTLRSLEKIDGTWHARVDPITWQSKGPGESTRPYGIFLLSRVAGATIVVEENVSDRIGAPPEWKERGRFTVP